MVDATMITNTANMIYWTLLGLIGVGALVAGVMFFVIMKRFNKMVQVRVKAGNTFVIEEDRCMEKINEDGHKFWIRFKQRNKDLKSMPAPPSSAMCINRKGKDCATALLIDGHYIWLQYEDNVAAIPPGLFSHIPEQVKDILAIDKKIEATAILKQQALNEWMEANGIKVYFEPFTPTQRAILVNSIKRAEERKMKGWASQLPMIVGIGAAIILVICLLVFYGNIAKPVLEMGDKLNANAQIQNEQLKLIQEIRGDVQNMRPANNQPIPGAK